MHYKKTSELKLQKIKLPYRISQDHIEEASEFMKMNQLNKIWIQDLKKHLQNKIPERPLSSAGVYHLMSKILNYSYKKAHKIPRKMTSKERIRDFIEAAYLQIYLEEKWYIVIYLDEFYVSMKNRSVYNWSSKGTLACWSIDLDPWTMSFIVAFSSVKIEDILASNISIKSFSIRKFVSDMWRWRSEYEPESLDNTCLVLDNVSFHVNEAATKFYEEQRIKWIYIPPYSPLLNPTDKLKAWIKAKICKQWTKNKPLNLSMVKLIVDSITEQNCRDLISSSRREWMKKLNCFEFFV